MSFATVCLFLVLSSIASAASTAAPAEAAAPASDSKTDVIMFGGYGSTNAQMAAWEKSASADAKRSADYNFKAIALPSRHFSQLQVKRDAEATIRAWVETIKKAPPTKKFVLTGHSSGSAVANEIMRRLEKSGRDSATLKLVILDGFAPTGISENIEVQCVTAVDAEHPDKGTWNQRAMKSCNTPRHQYRASAVKGCQHVMCLHFSTINAGAGDAGITSRNFKQTGYKSVRANLDWLDSAPAATPPTIAPAPPASR